MDNGPLVVVLKHNHFTTLCILDLVERLGFICSMAG